MPLVGEQLGHYYQKGRWLFKDFRISLMPGEVAGLSGYSGSGKTTLARILAGYIPPRSGRILVDGTAMKPRAFRPVQLIYQHPEKAVNPKWRMADIVTEAYTPSQELLDAFEIRKEWMSRWPIELSGGELQRFCIVRALHPQTRYIIADEMTAMLDAVTQAKIWHTFPRVCKRNRIGVIVVSHDTSLLKRLCASIYRIEDSEPAPA
jgi:peptide/nickel transport system ATP-binding protein